MQADAVSEEERRKAKTVTYGIIYGLTPAGLAASSAGLGIDAEAARFLISSFLSYFSRIESFVERTKAAAHAAGEVRTLAGRRRPIKAINSSHFRYTAVQKSP